MRKFHREHPPLSSTDRLKFGKYRGRLVWEVIRDDPAYILWLLRNLEGFRLDEQAMGYFEAVRRARV